MKTECLQSDRSIFWGGKGKRVVLIKRVKLTRQLEEELGVALLFKVSPSGPGKCELI